MLVNLRTHLNLTVAVVQALEVVVLDHHLFILVLGGVFV